MARAANERALERTRPAEISAVERLARALQRHRIYPHGSPLCREAAEEAREALSALPEASVELRVDPDGLVSC